LAGRVEEAHQGGADQLDFTLEGPHLSMEVGKGRVLGRRVLRSLFHFFGGTVASLLSRWQVHAAADAEGVELVIFLVAVRAAHWSHPPSSGSMDGH
jgi:hypothetical protein